MNIINTRFACVYMEKCPKMDRRWRISLNDGTVQIIDENISTSINIDLLYIILDYAQDYKSVLYRITMEMIKPHIKLTSNIILSNKIDIKLGLKCGDVLVFENSMEKLLWYKNRIRKLYYYSNCEDNYYICKEITANKIGSSLFFRHILKNAKIIFDHTNYIIKQEIHLSRGFKSRGKYDTLFILVHCNNDSDKWFICYEYGNKITIFTPFEELDEYQRYYNIGEFDSLYKCNPFIIKDRLLLVV